MKLAAVCRARNEEHILKDVLDHVAALGFNKIYVYDDASTDGTADICRSHGNVVFWQRNTPWDPGSDGRQWMEGVGRQVPYDKALAGGADWIYVFDADEFANFRFPPFDDGKVDAYALRLFDFYITPDDMIGPHSSVQNIVANPADGECKPYTERKWMGPEYRDIPMIFRARPRTFRDRVPLDLGLVKRRGYVRHYGKAISPQHWEETCNYYVNHRWADGPDELRQRWEKRRGKAVHELSDFGRELIGWGERFDEEKIVAL